MKGRIQHNTVSQEIQKTLKEMIINEEIKSGSRLNIDEFSRIFQTSKIPIREALRGLENEELVIYVERAGWKVSGLSRKKIHETIEIQSVLENYVAKNMIKNIQDRKIEDNLREMSQANDQYRLAALAGRHNEALSANFLFHAKYYDLYSNESLAYYMKLLWNRDIQFRREVSKIKEFIDQFFKEHQQIIKALEKRDVAMLGRMIEKHFLKISERIDRIIDNAEERDDP